MSEKRLMPVYWTMLLLFTLFLASCADSKWTPEPVSDPKLDVTYQRILVLPVDIGAKFAKDYRYATADCRDGVLERLTETKRFQVNPIDAAPATATERGTLVVKLEIADIRMTSKAARFWGGAFAGSSYVNIKMTLTDGHTGQVIRDKEFSTHNNAFAAAYASGSTDASIPKDMGRIVGDYIIAVVPQVGSSAK